MFRYSGEYFDKETGTIYLRARYYNPSNGRFISEDSVWGKDNDPLSLNLCTYCQNDPLNFYDPSGHKQIVSDYTFSVDGNSITLKQYQYTEIGLTVYELPNSKGFFNRDPYLAADGYFERVLDYENPNIFGDVLSKSQLGDLKDMDSSAKWNKVWNWVQAGVSTASDFVAVVKVAKIIKIGGGMAKVITETGKEVLVPEVNIFNNPAGGAVPYISVYNGVTSKDGYGKRAIDFFRSLTPIVGTYDSVKNAINYGYRYEVESYEWDSENQ